MRSHWNALASVALIATTAAAQEPIDRAMVAKIRTEGLEHSRVWSMAATLAPVTAPRLAAPPAHMRAATWARDPLPGWGLRDVHFETFPFGRGWELEKLTAEMTAPRYAPFIAYADAWSPS